MSISKALAFSFGIMYVVLAHQAADAQQVRNNAMSKVKWYNAPREIQILDERPVVKDFREAPASPDSIDLPPGPLGGRKVGGGGAGAMGGDDGGVLPADGMKLPGGGGQPGYRTDNGPGGLPLPHADFNHAQTNIPARGLGPKGPLPGGFTTGIHGKVMPWASGPQPMAAPTMARSNRGPAAQVAAPVARSYSPGGGYGPSVGTGGGNGGANTAVTGRLLGKVK